MKNYFTDKNATTIPWVESPFFYKLLESSELSEEEREQACTYHENGYVVVDLQLTDEFIEGLKKDILSSLDKMKTQEGGYHYSDSPRIFEAWKHSSLVREVACHDKIIKTLKMLYNKTPIPFQTINFIKGSNQPLHSDAIHFHTIPQRWVCGVWTALEDMDEDNGTLLYCPGSHKLPIFEFPDLGLIVTEYGEQFENYEEYENFVRALSQNYETKKLICKKGHALVWAANILHGGDKINDNTRSRWSQATHYYFPDCDHYYSPMFSEPFKGKYADKDLTKKNIMETYNKDGIAL